MEADGIYLLWEAIQLTLEDLMVYLPKIVLSIGVIVIYVLVAVIMTRFIRKILKLIRIDEILKPFLKDIVSVSSLIVVFLNLGLALLATYSLASILFPTYLHILTLIVEYVARIVSVIFVIFFTFILLSAIVEKVKMETKMKGFMLLMTLFITLILIVDVTAISEEVKASLAWGISLGLGLSIGVFAAWYFFHEYLSGKQK